MKRLLILLLISLSVGACSATNSTDFSVASQYQPNTGAYALGLNAFKKNYYTVPNVAQQEFDRCVSFVLRDMQVGEQCTWEVPDNSIGIVKQCVIEAKKKTGRRLPVTATVIKNGTSIKKGT
jgi:phage-related protein